MPRTLHLCVIYGLINNRNNMLHCFDTIWKAPILKKSGKYGFPILINSIPWHKRGIRNKRNRHFRNKRRKKKKRTVNFQIIIHCLKKSDANRTYSNLNSYKFKWYLRSWGVNWSGISGICVGISAKCVWLGRLLLKWTWNKNQIKISPYTANESKRLNMNIEIFCYSLALSSLAKKSWVPLKLLSMISICSTRIQMFKTVKLLQTQHSKDESVGWNKHIVVATIRDMTKKSINVIMA